MHYQLAPAAEVKVVRSVRGALWDVIVDLRARLADLSANGSARADDENRRMMYVPRGFAHGIVTLTDNVEALYLVSALYAPEAERGVRWNDPARRHRMADEAVRKCRRRTASGRTSIPSSTGSRRCGA